MYSDAAEVLTLLISPVIVGTVATRLLVVRPRTVAASASMDDFSAAICGETVPFAADLTAVRSPWIWLTADVMPLLPLETTLTWATAETDALRFASAEHSAGLLWLGAELWLPHAHE